jgi:hypothetical protein
MQLRIARITVPVFALTIEFWHKTSRSENEAARYRGLELNMTWKNREQFIESFEPE